MRIIASALAMILVLEIAGPAFAQDKCWKLEQLPISTLARQVFARSRLIVEARPDSTGNIDNRSKKWDAYQGNIPVDEELFWRICGREAEAARVHKRQSSGAALMATGFSLAGLGLLFAVVGGTRKQKTCIGQLCVEEPKDNKFLLWTGILSCASGILMGFGGVAMRSGRWATYRQAQEAALEYNESLCRDLTEDIDD